MKKKTLEKDVVDRFYSGYDVQEIYRKLVTEDKLEPEQASEIIFSALRHPNL